MTVPFPGKQITPGEDLNLAITNHQHLETVYLSLDRVQTLARISVLPLLQL